MTPFLRGILSGLTATFAALLVSLGTLAVLWPDRLPAPAISRLVVADEKLRFLRDNPDIDPEILAVGSSIAWRQLDGDAIERDGLDFLNGGMVHMKTHHTREVTALYLEWYRNVRKVLVMVSLPDLENCTDAAELFDAEDATRYAFKGWPAAYFYLRYFDLKRYVRTAVSLPDQRTPYTGEYYLDEYGSGPVQVPHDVERGLRYGEIHPDPACTDALIQLARVATERGTRVAIVFPPVHPDYRRLYPGALGTIAGIADTVRAAVPEGTRVSVLFDDDSYTSSDFWDAFHLQWSAVKRLSRSIGELLDSLPNDAVAGTPRRAASL